MSLQSDAANAHTEGMLREAYPLFGAYRKEYRFCERLWRFDYAVPSILCAKSWAFHQPLITPHPGRVIELDGGTFQGIRSGHSSGVGLRNWREKNNAAMSLGWRVWHYAPEEVIRSGRKMRKWGCSDGNHGIRNPARRTHPQEAAMAVETKAEAKRRNRRELASQGITIGCRPSSNAKAKNRLKYPLEGVCLVCGEKADACKCDDRSEWLKKRNSS